MRGSWEETELSLAALKRWNQLHLHIRLAGSLAVFNSLLKTYFFSLAFNTKGCVFVSPSIHFLLLTGCWSQGRDTQASLSPDTSSSSSRWTSWLPRPAKSLLGLCWGLLLAGIAPNTSKGEESRGPVKMPGSGIFTGPSWGGSPQLAPLDEGIYSKLLPGDTALHPPLSGGVRLYSWPQVDWSTLLNSSPWSRGALAPFYCLDFLLLIIIYFYCFILKSLIVCFYLGYSTLMFL